MRAALTSLLALFILLAAGAEGAELRALISILQGPDQTKRREAAQELGELGPEAKDAIPALRKALRDKDLFVRRFSAQALGKIGKGEGDKDTISSLFLATGDEKEEVQKAAVEALAQMGPGATDALINLLKDPNKTPYVRKKATQGLGTIGKPARKALNPLTDVVTGKIKTPKAKAKGKDLNDEDIRPDAATALASIANKDDTTVIEALKSVSEGKQKNKNLQKAAADALRRITGEKPKKKK
jgi:HEAT repeat protein